MTTSKKSKARVGISTNIASGYVEIGGIEQNRTVSTHTH